MPYKLINEMDSLRLEQLMVLYANEWWTNTRKLEEVKKLISNTTFVFGVVYEETDELVGFTRVLSDKVYKALVFDVIVRPDHRDKQLGKMLIEAVLNQPEIKQVETVELYCHEFHEPFYEKFGFFSMNEKMKFMRRNKS